MSRGIPHIITYGSSAPRLPNIPDILGAALPAENSFLHVDILRGAETGPIHTQLVGDYNLPNVLVAVAVGKHFGVPDNFIRESIESYTPSNSRSQLIERSGLHIILDAYNANPSSMRAAIENFARLRIPTQPKDQPRGFQHGEVFDVQEFEIPPKVLILGAMAELGPESLAEHQGIVDLIARYPWEKVVLVGGDFLKLELPANFLRFTDSPSAAQWLKAAGTDLRNAYLLIKGSRSQKMEAVLE
jgi:UDP-N-acetylmuramoyl-tripeptide--D-alanyl-D-alanine ligase